MNQELLHGTQKALLHRSNSIRTVCSQLIPERNGRTSWQSLWAAQYFTAGVHRWTIAIKKNLSKWIFIGVVAKDWRDHGDYIGHKANSWAYGSYSGWGKTHNDTNCAYGRSFTDSDKVQVTLNMDNKTLSFALNGQDYGACHSQLADEVAPAVTLYKSGDSVELQASD